MEKGRAVIASVKFYLTVGEEGDFTKKPLNTREDIKREVREELHQTDIENLEVSIEILPLPKDYKK